MIKQYVFRLGPLFLAAACAFSAGLPSASLLTSPTARQPKQAGVEKEGFRRLNKTQLYFEPNVGQSDPAVRYLARGGGFMTLLTGSEALFVNLKTRVPIRLQFRGASSRSRPVPAEPLPGISNYFLGKDPSQWHTDVPHYARLRFENVYENIDAVFYSNQGRLEYDFIVKPGADPNRIELAWQGVDCVTLDNNGDLVVSSSAGDIRQKRPVVYQLVGGRQVPVEAGYVAKGANRFAIRVKNFDRNAALVIDPSIFYSTYLGGSSSEDISGLAIDGVGSAFLTGFTSSSNFPVVNAFQAGPQNQGDAFVSRIAPVGEVLLYSTYLGGEALDRGLGIAVDSVGNAYITGLTGSFGFPTTIQAYQRDFSGVQDAFIVKLAPNGNSIIWATFLGTGDTFESGNVIAVDVAGNVIVAGITNSPAFPTTPGAYSSAFQGSNDGFVSKLDPTGHTLLSSTLFGGSFDDFPYAIALDPAGNIYLAGGTGSTDFPTTPGAYSRTQKGAFDAFVLKFSHDCKRLLFSTLIGSSATDIAYGLSIEPGGRIAIAGQAGAADFPTTTGAYHTAFQGTADGFVARFNSDCSVLIASTMMGTTAFDYASGVVVQEGGFLTVAGYTESNNFPVTSDAFAFSQNFGGDGFLMTFLPLATASRFVTVLGGSGLDQPKAMGITPESDVIIVGNTASTNFPVTTGTVASTLKGGADGFVTRVTGVATPECQSTVSPTITSYSSGIGNGGIAVGDGCVWNAFPTTPWISADPANAVFGSGAGSLNYKVAANTATEPRAGAIYVAGNLVPIIQKGTLNTQIFTDVPVTDGFADFIRIIRNQGVTTGCGTNAFCPNDNVTRSQMAVFLVRGMLGTDDFQFRAQPYFTDVPTGHPVFKWVQKLRELNITTGCSSDQYCPNDPVTRGQMAVFLVRARYGNVFNYNQSAYFTDVGVNNNLFPYVQKLKSTGITTGCGAQLFCVGANITRGQMAVFLARGFFTPW